MALKTNHILVPVDLAQGSLAVCEYAAFLARALKSKLTLLYVWSPPQYVAPDVMVALPSFNAASLEEHAHASARGDFDKLLRHFEPASVEVATRVETGRPAAAIVRVAEELGADLIVIGTHGRTGVKRWWMGSVAQEVIAHAPCPVVTVHTPPSRGEP